MTIVIKTLILSIITFASIIYFLFLKESISYANSINVPINSTLSNNGSSKPDNDGIYLVSGFSSSGSWKDVDTRLHLYVSDDLENFTLINENYRPNIFCRDPSIFYRDGVFYCAWTSTWKSLPIYKSTNLKIWEHYIDIAYDDDALFTAAPDWFIDDNGSVYLFFCREYAKPTGHFPTQKIQLCYIKFLSDDFKIWSPIQYVGFEDSDVIDPYVIKHSEVYYLFYTKRFNTIGDPVFYTEIAMSKYISGPYTKIRTEDFSGWGTSKEGPFVIKYKDKYRIFLDDWMAGKYYYSESTDLLNWNNLKEIISKPALKHFSILKITDPEGKELVKALQATTNINN